MKSAISNYIGQVGSFFAFHHKNKMHFCRVSFAVLSKSSSNLGRLSSNWTVKDEFVSFLTKLISIIVFIFTAEWCARILKSYEPALLPDRQLMIQQDQMEMVEHYSSLPVQQSSSAKLSTSTAVQPADEDEEISEEEEQSNRTKEGWCTLGELDMTQTNEEEEEDKEHSNKEEDDIYENISDIFNNSSAASVKTLFVPPHNKKKKGRHHRHGNAEKRQNAKNRKKYSTDSDQQLSSSSSEDFGAPLASSSLGKSF